MANSGFGPGDRGGRPHLPLDEVLQHLPGGILIAEAPGGRLLHSNREVEKIWRRPLAEVERIADYVAFQAIHSDGRSCPPEQWPLARSLAGETVEGEEIGIRRGDGSRGIIRVDSSPIRDPEGRIVAAVATCFDITVQKRKEAARRLLAESSALLTSSLDYERTLRNVARLVLPSLADWCSIVMIGDSGQVERLVVESADPARRELAHEMERRSPARGNADRGLNWVLRTGVAELISEIDDSLLRTMAHDAEHLSLLQELEIRSAMLVPLKARGRILGAIELLMTEAERRYGPDDLALVEELALRAALAIDNARLYHEAQVGNRAKSDFLAVISHELRTPLTAIIGYAELLGLGVPEPVSPKQREQVERIEIAARHLLQLIEEILSMVNLEAGQVRVRHEEVDMAALLDQAAVITQPMADAKDLPLRVQPVEAGLSLRSDPDKLLQVLLNLLSNAVKFTDRGEIRLSAQRHEEGVEISVQDTGVGVDPRYLQRIFDPFWQLEQPVTRRVGGTGLGLTISRRLTDLLGGEISVDSKPGIGSTFRVRLPLQVPE